MYRQIFLAILFSSIHFIVNAQEGKKNVIQINLGTTQYKRLLLRIQCHNKPDPDYDIRIPGYKRGDIWSFEYPDSLYDKSFSFSLEEPTNIDTLTNMIGLKYVSNNDTLWATQLSFENKDTTLIDANFLQTDTFPQVLAKDKDGNAFFRTVLLDFYLLKSGRDNELLSSIEATKSKFHRYNVDSSEYDREVNGYIDLVKKYPDSHSLIEMLSSRLNLFNSKRDVRRLFSCFSSDNRHSYYGNLVNQYLADTLFNNSVLKAWDSDKPELIVSDSTKYNLVVFSASWCIPCIKEIPLLKKVYTDLSDKLEITYVSIDESKTVGAWRRLMRDKNIPWRSVLATADIEGIRKKYFVPSVPYTLFVHPGGFVEPIELRDKEKQDYLYKTVK